MNGPRPLVPRLLRETDLYCLTGEKFSRGRGNVAVVTAMLDAGVRIIQYREKTKPTREMLTECRAIRQLTRDAGAALIVNDDVALALLVEADGVHLGQDDLPVPEVRRLVGPTMAIGLSTHSPEQAQGAVAVGADYIGVGPIYRTFTKEDVCDPVGLHYLDHVVARADVPFVAIGGIKEHNVGEVIRHGARCVAMVTEIVAAEDIGAKIRSVLLTIANHRGNR